MRTVMAIIVSGALAAAALTGPALADSKMQQCAAQWQQLKAANKTNGQSYKDFSAQCMKGSTPVATTPKPTPAASVAKPASTTASAGKGNSAQNNKMKQCAAQWDQMKAQNKTGGQTYKQWSSKCLKS
ncbi:MAG TPA: hypothetical protein VG839_06600 [Asticcacaulis sp.]|nr:hypothetical protein [Asticcacaulis sp.]